MHVTEWLLERLEMRCSRANYTPLGRLQGEWGRMAAVGTGPTMNWYITCTSRRQPSADIPGRPLCVYYMCMLQLCTYLCMYFCTALTMESSFGIHGIVFRESVELSFGHPRIHLVGVLQTIFGRPQIIECAKSSLGVSEIVLWNRESCVNHCAISFERSAATLQRIIPQVRTEVPRIRFHI